MCCCFFYLCSILFTVPSVAFFFRASFPVWIFGLFIFSNLSSGFRRFPLFASRQFSSLSARDNISAAITYVWGFLVVSAFIARFPGAPSRRRLFPISAPLNLVIVPCGSFMSPFFSLQIGLRENAVAIYSSPGQAVMNCYCIWRVVTKGSIRRKKAAAATWGHHHCPAKEYSFMSG